MGAFIPEPIKCLQCVAMKKQDLIKQATGKMPNTAPVYEPKNAVTWVPAWQHTQFAGQIVMACVAVPCCEEHMEVHEQSAAERAIAGGHLLQGMVGS